LTRQISFVSNAHTKNHPNHPTFQQQNRDLIQSHQPIIANSFSKKPGLTLAGSGATWKEMRGVWNPVNLQKENK